LGRALWGTPAQVSRAGRQYLLEQFTQAGELGLRQLMTQLVAVQPTSTPKQVAQSAVRPTFCWIHVALQAEAPRQPLAQACRVL
jgi:hypothetical protein